ncbi:MAG TPA: hypothetical protein VIH88_05030 [Candidatus Acidoferrales bacterium]
MRKILTLIISLVLVCPAVWAQNDAPLSDSELAAITARGRFLAGYDIASWHATDAVLALKPAEGTVGRFIAKKTAAGWNVVFGKLNETGDAFLTAYDANQGSDPRKFTVKTFEPPQKNTGFFYIAAKAIETSLQSTRLEKRPYNTYVLPLDSGQLYVYVLPAQTVAEVYPLGGDVRYLVSADGTKIMETRQLHKSILEVKHSAPSGSKPAGGFHTHVLTDTPEDTDVFHVLRQTHPLPEAVGTKSGIYMVEIDGTIKRVK